MFERLGERRLGTAAVVIASGALALSGCGDGHPKSEKPTKQSTSVKAIDAKNQAPKIEVIYYPNGVKELIGPFMDTHFRPVSSGGQPYTATEYFPDMLEFCDGHDMVEETAEWATNSPGGMYIRRHIGSAACDDMRLEPSDFPKSPAEQVIVEHK